jgi:hypothetical protein
MEIAALLDNNPGITTNQQMKMMKKSNKSLPRTK